MLIKFLVFLLLGVINSTFGQISIDNAMPSEEELQRDQVKAVETREDPLQNIAQKMMPDGLQIQKITNDAKDKKLRGVDTSMPEVETIQKLAEKQTRISKPTGSDDMWKGDTEMEDGLHLHLPDQYVSGSKSILIGQGINDPMHINVQ